MTRQHQFPQNLKLIAGSAFAALGLAILFGRLDAPVAKLTNLLGTAACEALKLVAYLLPSVWRALQAFAFGMQPATPCPVQMLASLWPLFHAVAAAV
jgi:hypothetical protein